MASRVNVKFVVILSTVLVLLAAGTGFLAYQVVFKTAEDLAAAGDAKMAEQDFKAAEFLYSKAVNKDPFNPEYLLKWREALESWTPETDRELVNEFYANIIPISRQLSMSESRANINYQIEHTELLWSLAQLSGGSRAALERVITDANDNIRFHMQMRPDDPEWLPLRRYRGIARARIATSGFELPEDDLMETEEDLLAVLAATPTDFDVAASYIAMKRIQADEASNAGRQTAADRLNAEVQRAMESFLAAAGPDTVEGVLASMLGAEIEFRNEASDAVAELGPAARPLIEEITARYQEETVRLADRMMALDPSEVDPDAARRLYAFESATDPNRRFEASVPVLRRAVEHHTEDTLLVLTLSDALRSRDEFEASHTLLQSLADRARMPLSLESVTLVSAKTDAVSRQVEGAVRAHSKSEDEADREMWLERAAVSRDRLRQLAPEGSPAIQYLDARIAAANEDYRTAQQLLDGYNASTNNTNREALWLAAGIARELNETGNVRRSLERLIELDQSMSAAYVALAELEYEAGRLELAQSLLRQAETTNPGNPIVQERLREIAMRLDPETASDPVDRAVFEAMNLAGGSETDIADVAGAVRVLRGAIEANGPDPRLFNQLARLQLLNGEPGDAAETVTQGLESFPDDESLLAQKRAVDAAQSPEAFVAMIRESDRTEVQQEVAIHAAMLRVGSIEEARSALDRATALAPNDPTVLELRFNWATREDDLEEARVVAAAAREANSDRMNGLSFRARLLIMEENYEDALAALDQAVEQSPNETDLLRMMSRTQRELGRYAEAIASLERALDVRPDEVSTVIELCQLLANQGRPDEALELARRTETVGRSSRRFMEVLLALEGSVGDKEGARDRRALILEARPSDNTNRTALIGLYITLGQWAEAMELIEASREVEGMRELLVALEARWHAEQADLEAARRVFAKRIAAAPPTERLEHYLSLSRFMLQRNQISYGVTALEQAARYQEPGDYRVQRALGSTMMRYGRFVDAIEVLQFLLENDPEADLNVALQAAEGLIALQRFDEAEAILDDAPDAQTNLTIVLLRARILLEKGEDREARALLDDAVSRWQNDHRVWVLRAEAEAREEALIPDALADLARAIELRPDLAETHRRRADLLARLGREDEALDAWRDAIRANPMNEDLRAALLATLIRREDETGAIRVAEQWFELRPRDVDLRARVGDGFASVGMLEAATNVYLSALQVSPETRVVLRLADLLLGAEPPRFAEADRVFADARAVVVTDPSLLLARARVFAETGRVEAARNDIMASFRILTERNADRMTFWFTTMRKVFESDSETLAMIQQVATQPGGSEWARLFTGRVLLEDAASTSQGATQLRSLADATRDGEIRYACLRALAGDHYNAGRVESAVAVWQEVVGDRPSDWSVLNNVAYALAADLGRAEEALPYARRAVQEAPNQAAALDTLGTVFLSLGRASDAINPLRAAVSLTRGQSSDVSYMVRFAEALHAAGEAVEARSVLAEVQALLDRGRKLDEENEATRQELLDQLGAG